MPAAWVPAAVRQRTGRRPAGARVASGEGRTGARAGGAVRHPSRCDSSCPHALKTSRRHLLDRARVRRHGSRPGGHPLATCRSQPTADWARTFVHQGDALVSSDYPPCTFHVVLSTGLGEFLDDGELEQLFSNAYRALEPAACLHQRDGEKTRGRDPLLRIVELVTRYRQVDEFERLLRPLPWRALSVTRDRTGLQTFATAIR